VGEPQIALGMYETESQTPDDELVVT